MRKTALGLVLVVAGLSVGCKGGAGSGAMSVDDIAATPPAGLTIKKLDTDDKVALDFLDPPGIETGCANAAHVVTNEGASYAVYDYESEATATMAMSLWKAGKLGEPPFEFQTRPEAFPMLGDTAIYFENQGVFTLVNRVDQRIVAITSKNARQVGALAVPLTKAIGGTVPTPAP